MLVVTTNYPDISRAKHWRLAGAVRPAFVGRGPANVAIDALHGGAAADSGVLPLAPNWDARRFGVNARASHWMDIYGLRA